MGHHVNTKVEGMGRMHLMERAFRRNLLRETIAEYGGNRTQAAKSLGLQRTYLLRLVRELKVEMPPARYDWPNWRVKAVKKAA